MYSAKGRLPPLAAATGPASIAEDAGAGMLPDEPGNELAKPTALHAPHACRRRLICAGAWLRKEQDMTKCVAEQEIVVQVGSVVTVSGGECGPESWQIVADGEADAAHGQISASTALAQAILGHGIGERVLVRGPEERRWWATIEGCTAA
jgi:transcription elongation GreA/GreB family factor